MSGQRTSSRRVAELPPGSRSIVEVDGRSIGVFNVGGAFYALRNSCPHQGAPLCEGSIRAPRCPAGPASTAGRATARSCAARGTAGSSTSRRAAAIFNPHRTRVKRYEVTVGPDPSVQTFPLTVRDGMVLLHL